MTTPDRVVRDAGADVVGAALDGIEQQFAILSDAYRLRLRQQASELDPALQPAGYRILLELVLGGPLGAGTLAEQIGFDKSALSRQLHQLEDLGLVAREPDPADRRGVVISATATAVERVRAVRSELRDEFRRGLAAWPVQDLEDLSRLLGQLAAVRTSTRS
ncbi:MarR family winged helix-turn-helix transcriptional regulator [Curtobacterium sp. L1-20]|uniref:MarR family winged helix-turn-helix transcriptional regulator n=1 Tax=Curtobacterium sp. L1-20 TaxID=3138181 RepID=UPI003B529CDB